MRAGFFMAARSDQVRKLGLRIAALLAGVMACAGVTRAEVKVSEPQPGMLVVEARDATVEQVMAEIEKSQRVQFESAGPLSGQVSGTYRGQLSRVVLRLLDGYDVVIRSSPAGLRVKVLSPGGKTRVATPAGGVTVPLHPAVSANVDADEEKAEAAAAPPRAAPAAAPLPPGPDRGPVVVRPPVVASGPAPVPSHPKVSSNVDLDEERSVGGN
jgi:hypothetical protein